MHYKSLTLALLMALSCVCAHPGPLSSSLDPVEHTDNTVDHAHSIVEDDRARRKKKHFHYPILSSWYSSWSNVEATQLNWTKINVLKYAYVAITAGHRYFDLTETNVTRLQQIVNEAHLNDVLVLLTGGGHGGSVFYSFAVATAESRTTFVKAFIDLVTAYDLDGFEIDWEYVASLGIGCNERNRNDAAHLLLFLQELRRHPVGKDLIVTAAVELTPFVGSNGLPMTDVSAFAKVLDYISLVDYDVHGRWNTGVAANSPLKDNCAPLEYRGGSAESAVAAWTAAKFPAEKLVLGVASYGQSYVVKDSDALTPDETIALYPKFNKDAYPKGDSEDTDGGKQDVCGHWIENSGVFNFWGLMQAKFLNEDGSVASGIKYLFDNCSETAYVYNPVTNIMVSYDDTQALIRKGEFINKNRLLGFSMWKFTGDSDNLLVDAIREGMGVY